MGVGLAPEARADEMTQRLARRLAEEAGAFERLAVQVLGRETLEQRAQVPPRRFRIRIRVGDAARRREQPGWQQRRIVSEYGFTEFEADGSGGNALHELRQVLSVDGEPVDEDDRMGPEELARIITARQDTSSDERKRKLLEQFERHGLQGAATDFGQLILLFGSRSIENYEFSYSQRGQLDGRPVLVFNYRQIDGLNALTFYDAQKDRTVRLEIGGEVWVEEDTYRPLRITLISTGEEGEDQIRQEATVDYRMSDYGAVLPHATEHRDLRGGRLISENHFTYGDFQRFGASSDIVFVTEPDELEEGGGPR